MEQAHLVFAAQRLKKLYRQRFKKLNKAWGLTQIETDILLFLSNNPDCDTARDIVELRGLSKSQVSLAIERLSSREFVLVEPDKNDRRYARLRLCTAALPICEQARSVQLDFLDTLFSGVSNEERAQLHETLERLIANAEEGAEDLD